MLVSDDVAADLQVGPVRGSKDPRLPRSRAKGSDMTKPSAAIAAIGCAALLGVAGTRALSAIGDDGSRMLTLDHYVRLTSKVASMTGQQSTV